MYPAEQEQDKTATWDLAVDNIIQDIKSPAAKKDTAAELNRLFKKGGRVVASIGNKPFYVCDVNRECHISLSRLNEIKQTLLGASLIENIESASRRERCFKLTEKGRQIQKDLIAVFKLIRGV